MLLSKRCIFCKRDSSKSRSIEHVLPESLGNEDHLLPRGVVCDGCNNYFASNLEQPVLESGRFVVNRFESGVPNKRGRVPSLTAILLPGTRSGFHTAEVTRYTDGESSITPNTDEAVMDVAAGLVNRMVLPASGPLPSPSLFSRFLGKVAVEALALRLLEHDPTAVANLIDEPSIDPLRRYCRFGSKGLDWPYHERTIYPRDFVFPPDSKSDAYEVLHEWTFVFVSSTELYFVLALFGVEYVINVGAPEIDGYHRWLSSNGDRSPLYS